MTFDFLARRPLFYAAVLYAALILSVRLALPELYGAIPPEDISRQAAVPGSEALIRGVIVSDPESKNGLYGERYVSFLMRCSDAAFSGKPPQRVSGKVRVSAKNPSVRFEEGDVVELTGALSLPRGRRNPGGFDYREYLSRRGVHALFYCGRQDESRVLERRPVRGIAGEAARARRYLSARLDQGFSEDDAAFLKALLLGERADIAAEFEDLFIRTGTLHILAVSGFNVGFLVTVVLILLAPFPLPKNARLIFALFLIWLYCLIVGWQAPLVRASVMATVFILGRILGRKSDVLNSLGLAALLILLVSPKSLFDVGFQLSFLAVAGLAVFVPAFMPRRELLPGETLVVRQKISLYAEELFWVSFVATMATLPVTVQNFYIVTPASLLANMVVVPLSFGLFFCGAIYFLTFWWVPKAILFLPAAMKSMMEVFTRSLTWIADWPYSCIAVGRLDPVLWSALAAGLVYFLLDKKIKIPLARAAVLLLFSLNVFLTQDIVRHFQKRFAMTALDVGQGDSIYFEFPGGGNLLIDAGRGEGFDQARRTVVPFLRSKGVRRIDAFVISHPQSDHIGGAAAVLREVSVKNVIDAKKPYNSALYRRLKEGIAREGSEYWEAAEGMRIEGFEGVAIDVLNPDAKSEGSKNINQDSLVLKIVYADTSFLMTGDIEGGAMRRILLSGADVRADVLKVPHHGAKLDENGIKFVRAAAPAYSVISAGEKNFYGHPKPETLQALASLPGNHTFRTDRQGAVTLISDGRNIYPSKS